MKKAVIACKVLYKEILSLVEDEEIDVEFLPQGLHDLPDSQEMRKNIQSKIDELEDNKDYDYIFLGYGYCSGGVDGLKTRKASLLIPKVHDCIPILLGSPQAKGNIDDGKTYYLSRGWIDCGGDTFKTYLFLVNKMDDWVQKFNDYAREDNALVDWFEKKHFKCGKHYSEEIAKYISYECIKNYESITIIDNNNLKSIHHNYAEEMYNFVNQLITEEQGKSIEFNVVNGSTDFLRDFIFFEDLDEKERDNKFLFNPPAKALNLGEYIIG